ncbi:hypothetical protein [Enorma massiliensis]|uniref:hypothetical protein n=1 Tax=Enorma massiliensis TaxID=1472761 RepID=UPI000317B820|nr:hypothetical protein [Enorma massiliensis]
MSDQMAEGTQQQTIVSAADVREGMAGATANEAAVSADEVTDKSAAGGESGVHQTPLEAAEERVAELEGLLEHQDAKIQKVKADHRRRLKNLNAERNTLEQALDAARIAAENERLRSELERIRRAGSRA